MILTNLKHKGKERFNIKKLYCKALFVENRKRRATFLFIFFLCDKEQNKLVFQQQMQTTKLAHQTQWHIPEV